MLKLNKSAVRTASVAALLIALAASLRIMGRTVDTSGNISFIIGCFRALIYISLFSVWGLSLRRRIIQTQARHYLTAVAALMVFWIILRTLKFMFFNYTHIGRYLWYLYYLPMLFIPLLALFIALSLGKSEKFRIPNRMNLLFVISALLLILVLTNDYHQYVFGLPNGLLYYSSSEYTHLLAYYLIMGWAALCSVTAVALIAVKCRVPYSKRRIYLPCIPFVTLIIYAVLYLTVPDFINPIAGDMTVTSCILIALAFEAFIYCGLIQSNTHYNELFECTDIRAIITDEDYNVLLSSADTEPPSKEIMLRTEASPVMLNDGLRLCSAPIKAGHVMWAENVSEITEIISELADSSEYLTTRRAVLHKEVETRRKEQRLTEQNRLYNRLMNDNKEKYMLFSDLISQLEATDDPVQEKKLTAKLAVVCAHIKRRGNLLFLSENGERISASELKFALEEWLSNLRLCEVRCNLYFCMSSALTFSQTVALYDTLQWMLLYTLDTLHSLLVTVGEKGGTPCLVLNLSCDCDLSDVYYSNVSISDEDDGEWVITISIPEGGAAV